MFGPKTFAGVSQMRTQLRVAEMTASSRQTGVSYFMLGAILVITSGALRAPAIAVGAEARTKQDDIADREFAIAAPEILRIRQLLVSERSDWVSGRTERLSPEVTALTDPSAKRPQLDDTRVPLHLRLIERERQIRIQRIKWAEAFPQCESPLFPPDKLLDAQYRQHALTVLQCHRERMSSDQIYLHRLDALEEQRLWELELPPVTRERMMSEARAKTEQTDIKQAHLYMREMALYQSIEDLIIFIDVRAATAYIDDGQLRFRDAAIQKKFENRTRVTAR
jgi:hypothetical protein